MTRTRFAALVVFFCVLTPSLVALAASYSTIRTPAPFKQEFCRAIDGDTLNCQGERVRLNGIDAPELHGCPPHRHCVAGNGQISKRTLEVALDHGPIVITALKLDRYGRTVAMVSAGMTDLSCWQLELGAAEYRSDWDELQLVRDQCLS